MSSKKLLKLIQIINNGKAFPNIKADDLNLLVKERSGSKKTLLMFAVKMGRVEDCELLLSAGADINAADNEGKTPLLLSLEQKNVSLAKLLLSKGANPNLRDMKGHSSIYLASQIDSEAVQMLLDNLEFKRKVMHQSPPAIFGALQSNDPINVIKLMKEYGADLFQRSHGMTLLHKAVLIKNVTLVSFLLNEGFSSILNDEDGNTPLEYAYETERLSIEYKKIVDMFVEKSDAIERKELFSISYQLNPENEMGTYLRAAIEKDDFNMVSQVGNEKKRKRV